MLRKSGPTRALDSCHRPEGSWALGTRMGDHEGHGVQTSVHFNLLGFHGFLSLYSSFSCVLPRPTGVLFLRKCEHKSQHPVVTDLRCLSDVQG